MQDQLIDAPTALDQLVSELNHSGKSQYVGLLFPVPTRLQAHLYGMVEALTHHAGTSRNKLMNQLVFSARSGLSKKQMMRKWGKAA